MDTTALILHNWSYLRMKFGLYYLSNHGKGVVCMEFSVGCVIRSVFFIELTVPRVNRFITVSSTPVRRALV